MAAVPQSTGAPPFSRTPMFSGGAGRGDSPTAGLRCSACSACAGGLSRLASREPLGLQSPAAMQVGEGCTWWDRGQNCMCLHIRTNVKHKSGPVFVRLFLRIS